MRYHSLNPDYIHERLKKMAGMYDLRVLLVQADVVSEISLNSHICNQFSFLVVFRV